MSGKSLYTKDPGHQRWLQIRKCDNHTHAVQNQTISSQCSAFFFPLAFFLFFVCCFSIICSLLYLTCLRFQTSSSISSSKSSSSSSASCSWSVSLILTSDWLLLSIFSS